jgi:hypothetical protein
MSELRELTGRELEAVGGGFLNAGAGQVVFNNTGGAGGGSVFGNGGAGGGVVVGAQIGQQINGIFSLNGIIG